MSLSQCFGYWFWFWVYDEVTDRMLTGIFLVIWKLDQRWRTCFQGVHHMAGQLGQIFEEGPQFLMWMPPQGCLCVLTAWGLSFLSIKDPRENEVEATMPFWTHPWKSRAMPSTMAYWSQMLASSIRQGHRWGSILEPSCRLVTVLWKMVHMMNEHMGCLTSRGC